MVITHSFIPVQHKNECISKNSKIINHIKYLPLSISLILLKIQPCVSSYMEFHLPISSTFLIYTGFYSLNKLNLIFL